MSLPFVVSSPDVKRIATFLLVQTLLLFASSAAGANTRLAIGTLGLTPESRNAALVDIVTSHLSAASGFDLVERRELNAVFKEASLGLSGVVRAKDAVRVGALLRAEQFLLGSSISVNGTNRLILRLVDARTGMIRSISVFRDNSTLEALAAEIAEFAREEIKHPLQENRDFLAVGVMQNLGVNNRFSDFPAQLRGSVAAALSGKVTVLERDVISFLANEVRMDMAGLTDSEGKPSRPMQFGFWIVDGFYQSYEIAEPEVQLRLRLERVLGGQQSFLIQGKPDEQYFAKICHTIEQAMKKPAEAGQPVPPTRKGEIEALEARARQLVDYRSIGSQKPRINPRSIWIRTADNPDKMKNALNEATRVFESILLLDPENNAAKMQLAGCLIHDFRRLGEFTGGTPEQKARAADYFREVVATGDAEYADDARISLALSCGGIEGINLLHQFEVAAKEPAQKERFRYHRSDLLRLAEHRYPVEAVMPCLRAQLLDELADLKHSTNEPVKVSLDTVLFGYRFDPQIRERVINALLPELLEKFPDLRPHILLAASAEQTTADSPVTAQFFASLKECEEHPERVWRSSSYFRHLSSTIEEETDVRLHGGCTRYQRSFDNRQYATVVTGSLARQRAAEKGLAPPLTTIGKMRLAESYMALEKWKEALEVFNELPEASPQAKNECRRHLGAASESEEMPDTEWKDQSDLGKVGLAYLCIERRQYSTAIAILESMGHRTVRMNRSGPWGYAFTPVLPALVADACRAKSGKPLINDPMRFELGETPYVHFIRDGPRMFSFEAEGEDLWIGVYSQIKMFRGEGPFAALKPMELHEFERTTRTGNTSLCVSSNYIWAGTFDDGLLEFDRRTKACRRLTMKDGLLLNGISGLKLQGQTLWIAYVNGANGAIGTLDLGNHKFSALTPALSPQAGMNSQPHYDQVRLDDIHQAPRLPIYSMTEGEPGEMWFAVDEKGVQRFRISDAKWDTPYRMAGPNSYFPAMAANTRQGVLLLANREHRSLDGEKSRSGGLVFYDYRKNRPSVLQIHQGLPSNDLTAVALDGRIAWVGGRGFVAIVDVQERKVLRIAYVSASRIRGIQLGRVHAWIQVSCGEPADPEYSGSAWTGVYRLNRSEIEAAVYTADRN